MNLCGEKRVWQFCPEMWLRAMLIYSFLKLSRVPCALGTHVPACFWVYCACGGKWMCACVNEWQLPSDLDTACFAVTTCIKALLAVFWEPLAAPSTFILRQKCHIDKHCHCIDLVFYICIWVFSEYLIRKSFVVVNWLCLLLFKHKLLTKTCQTDYRVWKNIGFESFLVSVFHYYEE